MNTSNYAECLSSRRFVKLSALIIIAFACFYLGNHWYDSYQNLVFFNKQTPLTSSPSISISPNANKTLEIYSVSNLTVTSNSQPPSPPLHSLSSPPPLHPPAVPERYGIVDENGTMRDEFDVGDLVENWGDENETTTEKEGPIESFRIRIRKFRVCDESLRDFVPCMDNVEAIRRLKSTKKGEKFERHCPGEGRGLDCLIPAPKGYKTPVPWPRSRNEVWFSNLPNSRLVENNWISRKKNKIKFPGADQYLNQISQMIPDIAFGHRTRVVLDVGCGLASLGAFLFSRNVITLSIAPKDENQIQFALERGVPAMVAAFATHRLLYPSLAFELIHCSSCQVNWLRDDGILLLEVNRMLRAGGFFVWAQPHEGNQQDAWTEMEDLTARICWEIVKNEKNIAIWKKPLNNNCYVSRDDGVQPPLCDRDDDADNVWNVDLKACISRQPENGYGANLTTWPERLNYFPDRLQAVDMDAYTSKRELFKAESKYWNDIIGGYVRVFHWNKFKLRNVLDMRAGFGGFAAALIDKQIDCWVMNVVPITEPNTLPAIYDRGLIGVIHDWCEPFDTYPRTYDLLHAAGLFSVEQKRCNVSTIVLEMDRILRPGGRVYIRDSIAILYIVKEVTAAIGWRTQLRDTSEGAYASRKLLMCEK